MKAIPMVYLAGPIEGESWGDAKTWREAATFRLAKLGIGTTDPLRGKDYLKDEAQLRSEYAEHVMSTAEGLFERDLFDVRNASALLVNVSAAKKVSIGTTFEVAVAHENRVPIVAVRGDDLHHKHPFWDAACRAYSVDALDHAIEVLAWLLQPYVLPTSADLGALYPERT